MGQVISIRDRQDAAARMEREKWARKQAQHKSYEQWQSEQIARELRHGEPILRAMDALLGDSK